LQDAIQFQIWADVPHRTTRNLDLAGYGEPSRDRCLAVFQDIRGQANMEDGLNSPANAFTAKRIKEDQEHEGVRVQMLAEMGNVRIPL
jgi:hypothetical protein